jgi:ferredoxin, 2Fe-2S
MDCLMPKVTYIAPDHTEQTIDVPTGHSVMEGAVKNGVPGIDADCGGACACATCHVFVSSQWRDRLPPPSEIESAMVECADNVSEDSRLSCQIFMTPDLDGLTVSIAKKS